MRGLLLGFVAAATSVAMMAVAQDYSFQGFAASDAMNQMHASMRQNMIVAPAGSSRTAGSASAPRAAGRAAVVPSTYRVDPDVRRTVEQTLIASVSNRDAEAGRRMGEAFAQQDFIALFDRGMAPWGLRSGNAVDALTAYWLVMWGAANDYRDQPSRAQVHAVRSQVASGFDFAGAGLTTAARQQEFAETLIYQTLLVDAAVEQAQQTGNTADLRQLGDQAQRQMTSAGLNLRQLRLTDQGFVPGA